MALIHVTHGIYKTVYRIMYNRRLHLMTAIIGEFFTPYQTHYDALEQLLIGSLVGSICFDYALATRRRCGN
jgi:hypothetical protein